MNKRIEKKRINLVNKEKLKFYLNELVLKSGFTIDRKKGINFSNCRYYLNYNSRDVTFYLKELPDWCLCISLNFYGDGVLRFFGEHDLLIDKFRPSSTYISETSLNKFIDKLSQIYLEPKYHFVNSLTFNRLDVDYREEEVEGEITAFGYQSVYDRENNKFYRNENIKLHEFIDKKYNDFYNERNEYYNISILEREKVLNLLKKEFSNNHYIINIGLLDKNVFYKGSFCLPRYEVNAIVKPELFNLNVEVDLLFNKVKELLSNESNFSVGYVSNQNKDLKYLHYKVK